MMTVLAAVLVLGGTLVGSPLDGWLVDVQVRGTLTPALIEEYRILQPPPPAPPAPRMARVHRGMGTDTERWRSLVAVHFHPDDVELALRIIRCESGGNPNAANPTSSARGLFQHLSGWYSGAWGYPAFDPYDPDSSIRAAAYLRYSRGSWADWRASQHCWG